MEKKILTISIILLIEKNIEKNINKKILIIFKILIIIIINLETERKKSSVIEIFTL